MTELEKSLVTEFLFWTEITIFTQNQGINIISDNVIFDQKGFDNDNWENYQGGKNNAVGKNFIFSTIKHKSDGLPGCRRRVIELIAHLSVQLVAWEFKPYSFPKIHAKLCDFKLSPDQSHSIISYRSR